MAPGSAPLFVWGSTLPTKSVTRNPPDEVYITQLRTALETQYREQDAQIDLMREIRELADTIDIPKELKRVEIQVRDPTIADENARVTATLTINPPHLSVTPAQPTDLAIEEATLREHWTEEVIHKASTRIPGQNTLTAVVDACVSDGGGCCKLLFTPDTWEERYGIRLRQFKDDGEDVPEEKRRSRTDKHKAAIEDAKKRADPPFTLLPVDIRNVYPLWEGSKITEVIEVSHRPTIAVLRQYDKGVTTDGRLYDRMGVPLTLDEANRLGSTITFIEHHDDTWTTYLALTGSQAHRLDQFEHGLGVVPYFFALGLVQNQWKGRKVGWGVSQSKRWLVQFRSFLLTLLANQVAQDMGSPLVEEHPEGEAGVAGEDGQETGDNIWQLNSIIHTAGKLHKVFDQPVAQSFMTLLELVSRLIEQIDTPRVSSQIGGGLEGAGFAINQVLAEAKTRHHPFIAHIEQMLDDLTAFLWHMVRYKIKETVWVRRSLGKTEEGKLQWIGIGPDELQESLYYEWHLDPEQAAAKLIQSRWLSELVQAHRLGRDQAIEAEGNNQDEVRRSIALDELRGSPIYKVTQHLRIFQGLGRGDLMRKAAELAQAMGTLPGMPPDLVQEIQAARILSQQYEAFRQGFGQVPGEATPGAMGNRLVPDMGNAALAPNMPGGGPPGQGSQPANGASVRVNGGTPTIPERSAAPLVGNLGG
jgi:hypothetical protein